MVERLPSTIAFPRSSPCPPFSPLETTKPKKPPIFPSQPFQEPVLWGPFGPTKNPHYCAPTRKPSNSHPEKELRGPLDNPRDLRVKPELLSTNTNSSATRAVGGAKVDGRYTASQRRPNSKESTASSQRMVPKTQYDPSSSKSSNTSFTTTTTNHSSIPPTATDESMRRPYKMAHGHKYLSDPASSYPLPFSLSEMHRQVLRTLMLVKVFGSPLCSPLWKKSPPKRILEVGCGNGYWSAMCHKHFARQGHTVSFTGIDIAPVASDMRSEGMNWRFVQHDLHKVPLPFKDEEFDVIMVKDLALISSALSLTTSFMEEYFRCLKPGGQVEIWDSDSSIRLLAPHSTASLSDSESENDDEKPAENTGTYIVTPQTPFKPAQNTYITEYNEWITTSLAKLGFTTMPCTLMAGLLAQEPQLKDLQSRRLAIPLSEMRWERADDSETLLSKDKQLYGKRKLTDDQAALRQTALLTFVMWIESMSPHLKEASEKTMDEWDRWYADMMDSLLNQHGTAAGECLEIGAWWATKKGVKRERVGNSAIAAAKARKAGEEGGNGIVAGEDKPTPYPVEPHPGNEWNFGAPPKI